MTEPDANLEVPLRNLVSVLREYGSFPPKVLPALQAAERALGVTAATPLGCPACTHEGNEPCCTRGDGCVVWKGFKA